MSAPDGVQIAVHELGGDGHPLLLAHATGFHGLVWKPLAEQLKERFRCISYDARGHGESGMPPDRCFDWRGFALDLLGVIDHLRLRQPYGFGHSSGGTALLLAEQAHQGSFRSLYCFEPIIIPADPPLGPDPDSWMALRARRRREVFGSREAAFRAYRTKPPLDRLDEHVLRAYVEHGFEDLDDGRVQLKCRSESEARIYEMASAHDCFLHLQQLRCPVTLAWGSETDAFSPGARRAVISALPAARSEVFTGLGHLAPLETPDVVAAAILQAVAFQ